MSLFYTPTNFNGLRNYTSTNAETNYILSLIDQNGGIQQTGSAYGDYLYWDGTDWAVDGTEIHIGTNSGYTGQGIGAVAIGASAGYSNQGAYSIAIGPNAGTASQPANTIVINASATALNPAAGSTGLFINPVRNTVTGQTLYYNNTTKEITFGDVTLGGPTGPTGPTGTQAPTGNTLTVDAVYGNDATAATNRYVLPFLTITAALVAAVAGENVRVRAGTYNESITIPAGVSLTGDAPQAVIIQKLGVTADTTLITMGANCRAENFTANLSSSGNYNLIGADFPTGTSITAKLRNSIWTITSTAVGSPTIIGVRSAGTSSTAYSTPNAIQRSTINVISSSLGTTRGILVSGANRFAVRDIVVYARGSGSNIKGAETTDAGAVLEIKTSTVGATGVGGTYYDIDRLAGTIYLGSTDLLFNNPNGNSFTPTQAAASYQYGLYGPLAGGRTYYLMPGTISKNDVPVDTSITYTLSKTFPLLFTQPSTVIEINITYTESISVGDSITFKIYKNNVTTAAISLTLNGGENIKALTTQSVSFASNDVMRTTLEVVGNPVSMGSPRFFANVYYY